MKFLDRFRKRELTHLDKFFVKEGGPEVFNTAAIALGSAETDQDRDAARQRIINLHKDMSDAIERDYVSHFEKKPNIDTRKPEVGERKSNADTGR